MPESDLNEGRSRRESSMQHLLAIAAVVSAPGVRATGASAPRRAACARLHLLGAIHCHAVLSARLGARAARDLRGLGQVRGQAATSRLARGPQAFHLGLRQPTSTLGTVSERLPATLSALPELGERAMALSLPLPPAVTRQHHDRSLCLALRLGAAYKRTKGAVKLHLLLEHQGYLPSVS